MHVKRSKLELFSPQEEKKHKKKVPVQGLANAYLQNLCRCLQNSAKHKQVFQTNNSILKTHFDITMAWSENITPQDLMVHHHHFPIILALSDTSTYAMVQT